MGRRQFGELLVTREELLAEVEELRGSLKDEALQLQDLSTWVLKAIGEEPVSLLSPAASIKWGELPDYGNLKASLERLAEACSELRDVQREIEEMKAAEVGR